MKQLAFTTFAVLREPYGHPLSDEFAVRVDSVFAQAETSPGFVARAKEVVVDDKLSDFERNWGKWGRFAAPRFYSGGTTAYTDARASTISVWTSIEAAFAFSYSGLHLEALKARHRWFEKPQWPSYALWWIDQGHIPSWSEAASKIEYLHDNGPSPLAFSFGNSFGVDGAPYTIDRGRRQKFVSGYVTGSDDDSDTTSGSPA